jgi:hypothetical protein
MDLASSHTHTNYTAMRAMGMNPTQADLDRTHVCDDLPSLCDSPLSRYVLGQVKGNGALGVKSQDFANFEI